MTSVNEMNAYNRGVQDGVIAGKERENNRIKKMLRDKKNIVIENKLGRSSKISTKNN